MTKTGQLGVRIDVVLRAWLYGACEALDRMPSEIVEEALRRELRRLERRHGEEFPRRESAPRAGRRKKGT